MKNVIVFTNLFFCFLMPIHGAFGQDREHESVFDLTAETIELPDTHADKSEYIWKVKRNPDGYGFELESEKGEKNSGKYALQTAVPDGVDIDSMILFFADTDLDRAGVLFPEKTADRYVVDIPALDGEYKFELVMQTSEGVVNLSEEKSFEASGALPPVNTQSMLELEPKKLYAEHIASFIFHLKAGGKPVYDLEKMQGHDMLLIAWNKSFFFNMSQFLFATPKKSIGGPDVAVSTVFKNPGVFVVFGFFKHNGKIDCIRKEVDMYYEEPHETLG